jgi:tetratricopeptide (TPR) repeat protein
LLAASGATFLLCAIGTFTYLTLVSNANRAIQSWKSYRLEGQRSYVDSDYASAETSYDKALSSLNYNPGAQAERAVTLCELARVENCLGKFEKAEQLSLRGRELYLQLLDARSVETVCAMSINQTDAQMSNFEGLIRSLSNLAGALDGEKKNAEATQVYELLAQLYGKWWTANKKTWIVMSFQMVKDLIVLYEKYDLSGDQKRQSAVMSFLLSIKEANCLDPISNKQINDALQNRIEKINEEGNAK